MLVKKVEKTSFTCQATMTKRIHGVLCQAACGEPAVLTFQNWALREEHCCLVHAQEFLASLQSVLESVDSKLKIRKRLSTDALVQLNLITPEQEDAIDRADEELNASSRNLEGANG